MPLRIEDGQEITLCSALASPVPKEIGCQACEARLVVLSTEYAREGLAVKASPSPSASSRE